MTRRQLPDSKPSRDELTLRFALWFLAFLLVSGVILMVVSITTG